MKVKPTNSRYVLCPRATALIALVLVVTALLAFHSHDSTVNEYVFSNVTSLLQIQTAAGEGVVFLKTHKCAGSTVTTVLFRELCIIRRLRCFTPERLHPGKTWNLNKESDMNFVFQSMGTPAVAYQVWLHHMVYTDQIFEVVPSAERIISIVREPSKRFESAWNWYGHSQRLGMSLSQFVSSIRQTPNMTPADVNYRYRLPYRTGLEATSEELLGKDSSDAHFQALLGGIQEERFVLLVGDRMDESLVVLSAMLDAPLHRFLHFNHKVNSMIESSMDAINRETLTAHEALVINKKQTRDSALYAISNTKLDMRIDQYGRERFQSDLRSFERGNAKLVSVCSNFFIKSSQNVGAYVPLSASNHGRGTAAADAGADVGTLCRLLMADNRQLIELAYDSELVHDMSKTGAKAFTDFKHDLSSSQGNDAFLDSIDGFLYSMMHP